MPNQYATLTLIIGTNNKGIKGTYGDDVERYLWPKALGQTNDEDRVLCVELTPDPENEGRYTRDDKSWRCYVVEDLDFEANAEFSVVPDDRPPRWRVRHLRRQNSVDDVEFFR